MKNIQLIHGDAFEELPKLAPGSVDCILTDTPYGTTRNAWDKAPDWERLLFKRGERGGRSIQEKERQAALSFHFKRGRG